MESAASLTLIDPPPLSRSHHRWAISFTLGMSTAMARSTVASSLPPSGRLARASYPSRCAARERATLAYLPRVPRPTCLAYTLHLFTQYIRVSPYSPAIRFSSLPTHPLSTNSPTHSLPTQPGPCTLGVRSRLQRDGCRRLRRDRLLRVHAAASQGRTRAGPAADPRSLPPVVSARGRRRE